MSGGAAIAVSVVLLGLNAFFVAAEFAIISARRSSIELLAEEGGRGARTTLQAMEQVSIMLACAQLGITICSLGLGYLGEPAIAHLLEPPFEALGVPEAFVHPIAFAIALTIVSFLHVVLGEMVPKNLALSAPDRSAVVLAPLLVLVVRALRPAIVGLNAIANWILHRFGIEAQDEVTSAFTRDEVAGLVHESRREGLLQAGEEQLVVGALTFEERDVRSVLLPVAALVTVSPDVTPEALEAIAARTGFSRFPVQREGELVGYLHLKDALEFEDRHRTRPIASTWIRSFITVAPDDRLRTVLASMQKSGAHLALVRELGGATLGVAALEDVVEELVGEIRDGATNTSD